MPVLEELVEIFMIYGCGALMSYSQKRGRSSASPPPPKGFLELLGLELCSFSEVTSGLVIAFLASNSLFFYLQRMWIESNSVH